MKYDKVFNLECDNIFVFYAFYNKHMKLLYL